MSDSNKKIDIVDIEQIIKTIEKKGQDELKQLVTNKNVNIDSLQEVMKKGTDEFVKKTGRNMTYSEIRAAYG
jgi:flagellar motility protein MotE (MotC chaperone)